MTHTIVAAQEVQARLHECSHKPELVGGLEGDILSQPRRCHLQNKNLYRLGKLVTTFTPYRHYRLHHLRSIFILRLCAPWGISMRRHATLAARPTVLYVVLQVT